MFACWAVHQATATDDPEYNCTVRRNASIPLRTRQDSLCKPLNPQEETVQDPRSKIYCKVIHTHPCRATTVTIIEACRHGRDQPSQDEGEVKMSRI